VIRTGVMGLSLPEADDAPERWLRGHYPDGGYWRDVRFLANHDHSGGEMGAPVAGGGGGDGAEVTITGTEGVTVVESPANTFVLGLTASPDASNTIEIRSNGIYAAAGAIPPEYVTDAELTAALSPYALDTDLAAYSPTTHHHDAAYVNTAGGDTMAGPLTVSSGGVAVTGASTFSVAPTVGGSALLTQAAADALFLTPAEGTAAYLPLAGGTLTGDLVVSEATPTVSLKQAADTQPRAQLTDTALSFGPGGTTAPDTTLSRTGAQQAGLNATLTVTPAAGQAALSLAADRPITGANVLYLNGGLAVYTQTAGTNRLAVNPGGGGVFPLPDNALSSGIAGSRWTAVYAVAGTINTSTREAKEGVAPLDPALALEAVRSTPAVTFTYTAPERPPEWYDLPDDPEHAQAVLEQRLRAAPLEAGARQQAGFVAEDAHTLFLVGEGQTAASNSVGVLLAALQAVDARLTALETTAP
jgi:hypothetical protein